MRRLTLLDEIKLRSTSEYRYPPLITALNVVYGNFANTPIPCTPIDNEGYIYHISDYPVAWIGAVYINNQHTTACKTYTSYQDETGRSIACVVFTTPQTGKQVTVTCKGVIDIDSGKLIENPADVLKHLFLTIQGYDINSINTQSFNDFHSLCEKNEIRVACILQQQSIKDFIDELATNIQARWLISDGKAVMTLTTASNSPIRYNFNHLEELEITSTDLINEVTIKYAYNYIDAFKRSITKHNPLSKAIYGTFPATYSLTMIQHDRQADLIADAILKMHSIPQIKCKFKHNLKSFYIEVGDRVTLTDEAGIGFNNTPAIITQKEINREEIRYEAIIEQTNNLYRSEVKTLSYIK